MKKILIALIALMALVVTAKADTYTYSLVYTGSLVTTSASIPVSGWLDKIEISQSPDRTCTVVVATYDANGTAIDTLVNTGNSNADTLVIRPRKVATTSAGVALTAGTTTTATYYGTLLQVPYEKIMVGGNIKVRVTGGDGAATSTNTLAVGFFYEPKSR